MTLSSGFRLGPYEILAVLGTGGMGEVYRAKDTRLDRTVAIKVLPLHLSRDSKLRQRFDREARTISSLNHPNICTLYDVGHQNDMDYLVMEYLEGEALAERLSKGPLPASQVLRYAIEIADALDKAHQHGFIHRDLKPSNIMLTKTGAKLLDFGLAKLRQSEAGPVLADFSTLSTKDRSLTAEGTILGTLQYMAPEQLEGREVDTHTDIFAFGMVVYEMATGRKSFEGKSAAGLIAAILDSEPPPISTVQPMTPIALDHVVRLCLAKAPDDRWHSAHDLAAELRWIAEGHSQVQVPPAAYRTSRENLAWSVAGLVIGVVFLATLGWGVLYFRYAATDVRLIRFFVYPPEKTTFGFGPAVSPDGRNLAFVASSSEGRQLLWIRPLDAVAARPLPGTEDASYPFWSPDGHHVGFFSGGKLRKINVSGGPPQTLCEALRGRGGAWNREGVIVFTPSNNDPLYRISEGGGTPTPVTALDKSRAETTHRWPHFFPDGRHFAYFARSPQPEDRGVYLGSLDSKRTMHLVSCDSDGVYADPGYLLFIRDGMLMAQPLNLNDFQLKDEVLPVFEQVGYDAGGSRAGFSVSENGVLAYGSSTGTGTRRLVWFDRRGKELGSVGPPDNYTHLNLSADEKRVALECLDVQAGSSDVWVLEFFRGTRSRLTFDPSNERAPVWSPDGRRLVFNSNRRGVENLYQKLSSGAGAEEVILQSKMLTFPTDWSRDGRFIAYQRFDPKTKFDLWILPMFGDQKPVPLLQTGFDEQDAQFSPDGNWVAYISNESGTWQVFVQSFPSSGAKWQVSTNGGSNPRWRRDGKELFYLASDGRLMAVDIKMGSIFKAGIPKGLFEAYTSGFGGRHHYDVTGDGQRFLVIAPLQPAIPSPVTVVINWTVALKR